MSIKLPPLTLPIVSYSGDMPVQWMAWFSQANALMGQQSGTTAQRPTTGLQVGLQYFDTTLGMPIWYDGGGWVDSSGGAV